MLYRYRLIIHLEYNKYALEKNPDSEMRIVLDNPYELRKDMIAAEKYMTGVKREDTEIDNLYSIKLYNTFSLQENDHMPDDFLICEVEGILAENEKRAYVLIEKQIEAICMDLTFAINRHNNNRHKYRPRIEANWMSARWEKDNLTCSSIEASLYSTMIQRVSVNELNPGLFLYDNSEEHNNFQFVARQYYTAFGIESYRSKYFQLFVIIEFVETKYLDKIAVQKVYSEKTIDEIMEVVKNRLAEVDGVEIDNKSKSLSVINKDLKSATVENRAEKLLLILRFMGITEYNAFGEINQIDTTMLKELIKLRHGLFHGKKNSEDDRNKYEKGILKLYYICELILEYMKSEIE